MGGRFNAQSMMNLINYAFAFSNQLAVLQKMQAAHVTQVQQFGSLHALQSAQLEQQVQDSIRQRSAAAELMQTD